MDRSKPHMQLGDEPPSSVSDGPASFKFLCSADKQGRHILPLASGLHPLFWLSVWPASAAVAKGLIN